LKRRRSIHLPRRPAAAGLLLWALVALLQPAEAQAGNARLLTTDEAAVLEHPVLGLQRAAVPLAWGFALDTSVLADLALAPNLGLRWALAAGPHRFVVGARYTHFMGASLYSSIVQSQEPSVKRFEPRFSGPSAYALYGLELGPVLLQAEARHALYERAYTTLTGALALHIAERWALIGEVGVRLQDGSPLRAAAGLRYGGENFGFALGAALADLEDPLLPGGSIPIVPVLDLSWTFR
jgi:hypothetical protein